MSAAKRIRCQFDARNDDAIDSFSPGQHLQSNTESSNARSKTIKNPLTIDCTLFRILSFLNPEETFKTIKRLSKYHLKKLWYQVIASALTGTTEYYDIQIKYNSFEIIRLLQSIFCENLENVVAWYCQILNVICQKTCFKTTAPPTLIAASVVPDGSKKICTIHCTPDFNNDEQTDNGDMNETDTIVQETDIQQASQMIRLHSDLSVVFGQLFSILAKSISAVDACIASGESPFNWIKQTDVLLLGYHYNIEPFVRRVTHLLSNLTLPVYQDNEEMLYKNELYFLFRDIDVAHKCFPNEIALALDHGRPSLLAMLSINGNFDMYNRFIKSIGDSKKIDFDFIGHLTRGILPMIVLYLRVAMLKEYKHFQQYVANTIHMVLMILDKDANHAIHNNNMQLVGRGLRVTNWNNNDDSKDNYDDAVLRLEMLYQFFQSYSCCTSLAIELEETESDEEFESNRLMRLAVSERILSVPDKFVDYWRLDKENYFQNLTLQQSFKIIIQLFLCGCNYVVNFYDNDSFISWKWQDEPSMKTMWNTMIGCHKLNDETLREAFRFPHGNENYLSACEQRQQEPIVLEFEKYDDPQKIFLSLLDIKQRYKW